MTQSTTIEDAMFQATDYGLLALGEIVRDTIYQRIERTYQVKHNEIPEKLDTFHKALQETLGAGAKVIERLIAKNIYSQLDLNFMAHANWTIIEYFDNAKKARELNLGLIEQHRSMLSSGITRASTTMVAGDRAQGRALTFEVYCSRSEAE